MLKYILLAVLALHCNGQKVIELKGNNFGQSIQSTAWPTRAVSGYTSFGGLNTLGGYGSLGFNPLSTYNYGLGLGAVGGIRSLGSVGGIRSLGYQSINVAPSAYNYLPVQQHVQHVAVQQPAYQTVHVQQPAYQTVQVQQPAIAVAQPAVATLALRPQVYAHQQAVHPVSAAIHQIGRTVEYKPVPYNDQPITPQVVDVEPSDQPIHIHFKSRSSTVRLSQEHQAGEPGTVEQTSSQDEPHKVIHEVVKPVIQEVREVIQPYRQLTQEVQPVVENVHTVVAHGEGQRQQYVVEPQIVREVRPQIQHLQQIQVQQARPVHVQQVEAIAQPVQYQTVVQQVPQYQTVSQVVPQYQQIHAVQQPIHHSFQSIAQPIGLRTQSFVQPQVVGLNVNRVVGVQQPTFLRSEIKEHNFGGSILKDLNQQRVYAESDK